MTDTAESATPEARAEAAARDLADRGLRVTARAVREAAGVRMAVAAEAARAWTQAQADEAEVQVPETPADVRSRLDAIWTDAYRAALTAVTPERDRLSAEVEQLRVEVDALTTAVADVETERDEHASRLETAEQERVAAIAERDEATTQLAQSTGRAERAEGRAKAAEAERDRLVAQVEALIARIPAAADTDAQA